MSRQRLNITIDEELLKELKEAAKIHCHSVSNEIEYRLKNSTLPFQLQFDNFKRTTPENPTGQTHTPTAYFTDEDGLVHKKHPLTWLRENNIDPLDTSMAVYNEFKKAFPNVSLLEFDNYQQSRRK